MNVFSTASSKLRTTGALCDKTMTKIDFNVPEPVRGPTMTTDKETPNYPVDHPLHSLNTEGQAAEALEYLKVCSETHSEATISYVGAGNIVKEYNRIKAELEDKETPPISPEYNNAKLLERSNLLASYEDRTPHTWLVRAAEAAGTPSGANWADLLRRIVFLQRRAVGSGLHIETATDEETTTTEDHYTMARLTTTITAGDTVVAQSDDHALWTDTLSRMSKECDPSSDEPGALLIHPDLLRSLGADTVRAVAYDLQGCGMFPSHEDLDTEVIRNRFALLTVEGGE